MPASISGVCHGGGIYFLDKAFELVRQGETKVFTDFTVPDDAIGCGFHEAVRGVLSHHLVIREGKIANYHPYPPTPWNASPRESYGTPGPYEDAVQDTPIFEENGPDNFKGIDIMRAVRSFDPCLPCGVHMYLGGGKVLKTTPLPHPWVSTRNVSDHAKGSAPMRREPCLYLRSRRTRRSRTASPRVSGFWFLVSGFRGHVMAVDVEERARTGGPSASTRF